jgi:CheY-like chemotaxis protein
LADILRAGGHEVVVTHNGADGLARFRAEPFDVVMTDLAMPGLSGWEVAQSVKALQPSMPIILVTGWGEELPVEELRARGIERVLAKPFELDTTLHVVAAVREPSARTASATEPP